MGEGRGIGSGRGEGEAEREERRREAGAGGGDEGAAGELVGFDHGFESFGSHLQLLQMKSIWSWQDRPRVTAPMMRKKLPS